MQPRPLEIVGLWQEPTAQDTTEFRADGTVVERPAGGQPIEGRYTLRGEDLTVKLDGMEEELSFSVKLNENALEMRHSDGQMTSYRRVQ